MEYAHDAHPVDGCSRDIYDPTDWPDANFASAQRSDHRRLIPNHSNVHVLYATCEVMKFICLLIYSSRVLVAPATLTALAATQRKKPRILTDAGFSQKSLGKSIQSITDTFIIASG